MPFFGANDGVKALFAEVAEFLVHLESLGSRTLGMFMFWLVFGSWRASMEFAVGSQHFL